MNLIHLPSTLLLFHIYEKINSMQFKKILLAEIVKSKIIKFISKLIFGYKESNFSKIMQ